MRLYGYDRTSVWDTYKVSNDSQWTEIIKKALEDYGSKPMRFSDKGETGGNDDRLGLKN